MHEPSSVLTSLKILGLVGQLLTIAIMTFDIQPHCTHLWRYDPDMILNIYYMRAKRQNKIKKNSYCNIKFCL